MKITISSTEADSKDNINVTWESSHDEHSVEELVVHLKGLLVAYGYHPHSVDENINDGTCHDWDICMKPDEMARLKIEI